TPGQPAAPAPAPPPLPAAAQWYIAVNNQQQGPYDAGALAAQVAGGALTPATLVWKAGLPQWTPAAQVPELASLFATTPPPLPPRS
ncbi:MAG TPA: DUF4339 domain-containing protein, partial [Rugosimonospora sp.]|nr:DUF4339 domain-containing protein [Rugosimonospora sp.]